MRRLLTFLTAVVGILLLMTGAYFMTQYQTGDRLAASTIMAHFALGFVLIMHVRVLRLEDKVP